jgi:hypothetical protein
VRVRTFQFGADVPTVVLAYTLERDSVLVGISGDTDVLVSSDPSLTLDDFTNPQLSQQLDGFYLQFSLNVSVLIMGLKFSFERGRTIFVQTRTNDQLTFAQLYFEDVS